jgi:hypothetical protein
MSTPGMPDGPRENEPVDPTLVAGEPATTGTTATTSIPESTSQPGYAAESAYSPESGYSAEAPHTTVPTTAVDTGEPARREVRMRTVVFGLVLLVIAGAVLVGQLTDISVDASAVVLAVMIGGGLLLIAGARRP